MKGKTFCRFSDQDIHGRVVMWPVQVWFLLSVMEAVRSSILGGGIFFQISFIFCSFVCLFVPLFVCLFNCPDPPPIFPCLYDTLISYTYYGMLVIFYFQNTIPTRPDLNKLFCIDVSVTSNSVTVYPSVVCLFLHLCISPFHFLTKNNF